MWTSKTLLCADIKRTRENDDYDRSPRREEVTVFSDNQAAVRAMAN